jgi:histidine triad (HIT) family protein
LETEEVSDCIFCKIVRGEIPAREVARDEGAIVIHDLNPQAPTHLLVIPTVHAAHLSEYLKIAPGGAAALLAAASKAGLAAGGEGYRVVINEGRDGGQTVDHLHLHVFAGRRMTWPPG